MPSDFEFAREMTPDAALMAAEARDQHQLGEELAQAGFQRIGIRCHQRLNPEEASEACRVGKAKRAHAVRGVSRSPNAWARFALPTLQPHYLSGLHRLVGRDHDPQALYRIVHVVAEVDVLVDRLEQKALLALAEIVMTGLVGHVDALVRLRHVGVMPEDLVGLDMGVDVVRLHAAGSSPP